MQTIAVCIIYVLYMHIDRMYFLQGTNPYVGPLPSVMFQHYYSIICSTLQPLCSQELNSAAWKENYREISMWTDRNKDTQGEAAQNWGRGVKPIRNGWKEQRPEICCHFADEHHQIRSFFSLSLAEMRRRQRGKAFFTPLLFHFINRWINKGSQSANLFSSFLFQLQRNNKCASSKAASQNVCSGPAENERELRKEKYLLISLMNILVEASRGYIFLLKNPQSFYIYYAFTEIVSFSHAWQNKSIHNLYLSWNVWSLLTTYYNKS